MQQVIKNLGVPMEAISNTMGLLLQSSTIAIVNTINLLTHLGKKKLCILQPAYFSVASCCTMFSLEYGFEQILFHNGQVRLPFERIFAGGYEKISSGIPKNHENILPLHPFSTGNIGR